MGYNRAMDPAITLNPAVAWRGHGWGWVASAALTLPLVLGCAEISATELTPSERRALLDALRPQAAQRAGQPVKFVVERLNVDGDWALLTGALVSASGGSLAWAKAAECHLELDKLLWAVARRQGGQWRVQHLEVCATEPPHWTLAQFGGYVWPCGVYAGLQGPTGEDLQAACRSQRAPAAPRP